MRRSLILTVAASVTMVLLAMLVPMAILLRDYAMEDRISRAALEVQATETVVSSEDVGSVSTYLERINTGDGIDTSVVYPDGLVVGPEPDARELPRIVTARNTGTARVDDVPGGTVILVPVSLGRSTAGPDETPVIRILVTPPGIDSTLVRSWVILLLLGLALLVGALVLADRIGHAFVDPIRRLARFANRLGDRRRPDPVEVSGPAEVQELAGAMTRLVDRVDVLLERERAGIADVSHRLRTPITALRLRVEALPDGVDPELRARLEADLDDLEATVDHVVREARRSEREGLVVAADGVAVLGERVRFWQPLAEDQGRPFALDVRASGPVEVHASAADLTALVDVLLDNAFTHTPEDAAVRVTLDRAVGGGLELVVEDGGPGLPSDAVVDRGRSSAGSTGLGLAIADRTAAESGGALVVGVSDLGGARVAVRLGPA